MLREVITLIEASPDHSKAQALVDYIYKGDFTHNPLMPQDVLMGQKDAAATVELRVFDNMLHIAGIQTLDPGYGGNAAMFQLCDLADRFGAHLHLAPVPYGINPAYIEKRKVPDRSVQALWFQTIWQRRDDQGAKAIKSTR